MDKIIVDIEPHEVTECVELLRKAGYSGKVNRRLRDPYSVLADEFKTTDYAHDSSVVTLGTKYKDAFPITMPELREAVKEFYS